MSYTLKKAIYWQLILSIIALLILSNTVSVGADSPKDLFKEYKGVIALDPGHGGNNQGAHGPEGALEKEVCLALANRITTLLEPAYRVVLTRSDDYDVPLMDRTAVADYRKADILISLHTGASFMQATTGFAVYSYKPIVEQKSNENKAFTPIDATPWHQIQERHITESRKLATTVQKTLQMAYDPPQISLLQAPLVILEGANMPAILIEMDYLTNPAGEKRLTSPETQTLIAQAIVNGITSYLAASRDR